ncbi:hypothetical protein NEMIN01_1602 [Nematocida minor]|uniref:uncharacterized protein n=1 Tax=Nematocida minor TaxID=1912983 RepID=UPI00221EFC87|nr:uncharacterized protein NEMIN01_1602 [Nematocida minor]KAI5191618.1 hypothetical protein NEMIN01_1602 [Nematocida minor]
MHGKSAEPHTPIKNNPNTKTLKSTQGTKPTEGFILTNTALNTYVYEYLKPLSEETYGLLEERNKKPFSEEIKNKKLESTKKNKNILNSLIGSLVDTVDVETLEITEEEKRSRRITNKSDPPADINEALSAILGSLAEETEIESIEKSTDYFEILKKVEKINANNRKKIIENRSTHISYLFYHSLLEKIDTNIETLFKKLKKKKKKEEDATYYQELEDLLEKRSRFKSICKELPDEIEEIEESTLGLESVENILNKDELEVVKDMLPKIYLDSWNN